MVGDVEVEQNNKIDMQSDCMFKKLKREDEIWLHLYLTKKNLSCEDTILPFLLKELLWKNEKFVTKVS